MKVLSVMQPWAMFIAIRLKGYETRPWDTDYRGPLLIHASQKISAEGKQIYHKIRAILGPSPKLPSYENLMRGVILCQVRLEDAYPVEQVLASGGITFLERALGDYSPGRFVWDLRLLQVYDPGVPAKGRAGLWEFKGKLPLPPQQLL